MGARAITLVVGLVVTGAVLTGCSQAVNGHGSPPSSDATAFLPSPSTIEPTTATPATTHSTAPAVWTSVTDAKSGFRFSLPGKAKRKTVGGSAGDGTPIERRTYTVEYGELAVSVTVVDGTSVPVTFANLDAIPNELIQEFKQAGATDFKILGKTHLTVRGQSALDFRISFTPLDHTAGKPDWYVRAIDADRELVMLQTIAFPPPGQAAAIARQVQATHAKLLAGLHLN